MIFFLRPQLVRLDFTQPIHHFAHHRKQQRFKCADHSRQQSHRQNIGAHTLGTTPGKYPEAFRTRLNRLARKWVDQVFKPAKHNIQSKWRNNTNSLCRNAFTTPGETKPFCGGSLYINLRHLNFTVTGNIYAHLRSMRT